MKPLMMIAATLACSLWLGLAPAHAQSDPQPRAGIQTQTGDAGTVTLHWNATEDGTGRPLIVGRVVTRGGKSGYCNPRLLVETLDPEGRVTAERVGFIPGYVGARDNVYFEEPIRAPGPGYRVSITSWSGCGGSGG